MYFSLSCIYTYVFIYVCACVCVAHVYVNLQQLLFVTFEFWILYSKDMTYISGSSGGPPTGACDVKGEAFFSLQMRKLRSYCSETPPRGWIQKIESPTLLRRVWWQEKRQQTEIETWEMMIRYWEYLFPREGGQILEQVHREAEEHPSLETGRTWLDKATSNLHQSGLLLAPYNLSYSVILCF